MKTIFITGASSGIGKATVELFAQRPLHIGQELVQALYDEVGRF